MPFASRKQEKYLFSQKPDVARRFVADAKRAHEPMISAADIDLYRRQLAQHYADMDLARGRHVAAADIDFNAVRAGLNAPPPVGAPAAPPPTGVTLDPSAQFQVGSPDPLAHPQTASLQQINDASQAGLPTPRDLDFVVAGQTNAQGQFDKDLDKAPGKVSPGEVALAGASGAKPTRGDSGGAAYDTAIPGAGFGGVGVSRLPATRTPLLAPEDIDRLDADQQAILAANKQQALTEGQIADVNAASGNVRAKMMQAQNAEDADLAQKRLDFENQQRAKYDAFSQQVSQQTVDPNRWWSTRSTGDKIRYTLAAILGGFVQGYSRGRLPNVGLDQINRHIADDLEAQRQDIEQKKGRLADMKGLLADAYRQTGDMRQAMDMAHAKALEAFDAEQQAYAAKTGSASAMAKSNLLSAQMQLDADKFKSSLYQYTPARTVGGGKDPRVAKADALADSLVKEGDDPELARQRAYATYGLTYSNVGGFVKPQPGQSDDARYQKYKDDLLAKNQIPLSRGEWDKAQAGTTPTGPGANVPRPESVAYDPTRFVQGTDAYKKELQQGNYNAAVYRAVFQRYPVGIDRSAAAQKAILDKFLIHPGDIQSTIDQKLQAAQSELGLGVGGGGGGDSGGGVQVTPETGD